MPNIPISAGKNSSNINKSPVSNSFNYSSSNPCWKIGHFDYSGKWGLKNLGRFTFSYTDNIYSKVFDIGDESLNSSFEKVKGKSYDSIDLFWKDFQKYHQSDKIPTDLVVLVEKEFVNNAFFEKIYPKLKAFEDNTWDEIRQFSHRRGDASVSNSHNVSIGDLCKEAQDRLVELKYSDRSEIYSLRLEGRIRIYGFRELNYLDIIWVDLNHEIYKSHR